MKPVRRKGFKLTASRRFKQEAFSFPRCARKFPHEPRPQFGAMLPWPIVTLLRRNGFQATKGCRNLALPAADCALSSFLKAEAAPAESDCVAREEIFARRAKTNLSICLKPRERLSLGRFAERVVVWLIYQKLPKCRAWGRGAKPPAPFFCFVFVGEATKMKSHTAKPDYHFLVDQTSRPLFPLGNGK